MKSPGRRAYDKFMDDLFRLGLFTLVFLIVLIFAVSVTKTVMEFPIPIPTVPAAEGAPPPGVVVDPALHDWFERQHNKRGGWCCDISDGHMLDDDEWRTGPDGYQVRVDGVWYGILDWQLRADMTDPNPTGHAIVWYLKYGDNVNIFCFAPGWVG